MQTRVDVVARHPELLEAWRPVAREFDIFFGLEAATDTGLANLSKDTTVDRTAAALEVAREFGYGITGNFVIDPDWTEADFERLWAFVETHQLSRAGFTILTPLPGTAYYEASRGADSRGAVVAVRHAPPALGAAPGRPALLRAVLRDLAAVGAEPQRGEEALALARAREASPLGAPVTGAVPDAADAAAVALHPRSRAPARTAGAPRARWPAELAERQIDRQRSGPATANTLSSIATFVRMS